MKTVYICGPYTGKTPWETEQNVRRAEALAAEVALAGFAPVCVHTMCRFFTGIRDYDFWCEATLAIMRQCDCVLLTPDWKLSNGACGEFNDAMNRMQPVFWCIDDLKRLHDSLVRPETDENQD